MTTTPPLRPLPPSFDAYDVALQLIRELAVVVVVVARHDADLVRQLRRAGSSVPLNLREGYRRAGADRKHLWRVAAGSADEVQAALDVAVAWGYLAPAATAAALALV